MTVPANYRPLAEEGDPAMVAARLRALLTELTEHHRLTCIWEDWHPVDLSCTFPQQVGLDFKIDFWLSGDEFGCGGDYWSAHLFPADRADTWSTIVRIVEGLITGEARVALYAALGRRRPYWTEVQLFDDGRWHGVSTRIGCAVPPIVRPTILRNGHPSIRGGWRPAIGSSLLLAGLAAVAFKLFG